MRLCLKVVMVVMAVAFLSTAVQAQASTIILVRHAEKVSASGDPALTPAGAERALALARALSGVHLASIISTQFQRTRLTAAPAAAAAGLETTIIEASGKIGDDAGAVARVINALPQGSAVLVVGHSNTLGPIIAALGGPATADLCDGEYGTMFILERPGAAARASLVRATYGTADTAASLECARP
jgi:broad specificity phosphatase PhoE